MHPNTAKKVLEDQDTLDIGQTAEAVRTDERVRARKDKPRSKEKSLQAHAKWLSQQQEQEGFRQKLKHVWNKNKKV